jgi:Protein of unknown function (DUF3040)
LALSMEEQRILDAMERRLADSDPRLASRLSAFGQPRLPHVVGSGRARAVVVLLSVALAALVTLMIYGMRSPAPAGRPAHPQQSRVITSPRTQSRPASQAATTQAAASGPAS